MTMPSADTIMLFAIPMFFVLIGVELLAARLMRRRVYRLNDAINSIGLGVLSQVIGVFSKLLTVGIYAWVVERVALQRGAGQKEHRDQGRGGGGHGRHHDATAQAEGHEGSSAMR